MKGILEVIKLIYGSKALSKILGTRTNVIRLPDNEVKRYIKEELNIEAASDKLAQKAKEEMRELIADLPKMNDAEKLILEGNLRRLANKLGLTEKGPAADVIQFTTKEKISPEGVMSLTEKIGQKNAPGTLMGNLESRVKQLEASGEDLSKLKGKTYDEFMKDITQGQKSMRKLEDEGLVRATAREIIGRDIKSGKIKLPKEIEQDIVQGGGEPINVFRQFYGEDALEQLDSMIPEFKNMYSPREAADAATKKFKFEFKADRPPGSISIEDAKKAEQEFDINKPKQNEVTDITAKVYRNADPDELIGEYNKNLDLLSQVDEEGGTLIGYEQFKKLQNRNTEIEKILNSIGIKSADSPEGKKITEGLIGKPKASVTELVTAEKIISDMKKMDPMDAMYEANKVLKKEGKYKNLKEEDVKRIMDDTNDYIFERDIPEDPEGFAVGGRVEMAGGGITKLVKKAMEFFSDNDPVSAYKKYLKYVKETAQKDPAKLAPEVGGVVVGSELIHRGLRRKLKEAKEKNDTDDSEDTTIEDRAEKAGGGVSQGLDYLTGVERRGYANGTLLDRYKELLNEIENPEETPYIIPPTIPQSEGRTVETITPIQTSIQQQLVPVGPVGELINNYLQMPGLLSMALSMGKDYIGLTDAQKDLYGSLGFGYSDQSGLMKDKLGFNVMASNFLDPKSTSRSVYKDKLGYTDEELDKIRNDLAGVPTKTDMRQQQRDYDIAQTQRQQDYFDLTNQGVMGIGLNPGAYAAHSLAAMGPAYDDSNQFSNDAGAFGGYNDFDGTEGTFSTDTSDTGASSGGVDSAGDGGDGYATGGRVSNGLNYLTGL
jgi:DNA-directed RNA polymerase subunit N (RpoN/RPB10)